MKDKIKQTKTEQKKFEQKDAESNFIKRKGPNKK